MTIQVTNAKPFNSYIAAANQTSFTFNWYVFYPEDIKIYKNNILLQYPIDFTVPAGSLRNISGGFINLVNPTLLNDIIVITRESDIKRTSGYVQTGEYRSQSVNDDFNYIITILQELKLQTQRAVILSPSDTDVTGTSLLLPPLSTRKGKYLAFDINGNLTTLDSTNVDFNDNWLKITTDVNLVIQNKKSFCQISLDVNVTLPNKLLLTDGKEFFIANISESTGNVTVTAPAGTSIDGSVTDVLAPGTFRRYVYNLSLQKFLIFD